MLNRLIGLFFAIFVLGACQKDYTCICVSSGNGTESTEQVVFNDSKKKATAGCNTMSYSSDNIKRTCSIQ